MKELVDFLMEMPLFDELSGNELKIVSRHMNYFEFKPGDVLFREGDPGEYVCFIVEGEVEVSKSAGGRDLVLATLTPGRSIGEMSIIDRAPRSASARARTPVRMVSMTDRGFGEILEKQPRIGIKILKGLSRLLSMNLRKTSSRLMDYMLPVG